MTLLPIEDGKFRIKLKSPDDSFDLPKTYAIDAYKYKWILYNTITAGGVELTVNCDQLTKNGYTLTTGQAPRQYGCTFPMDKDVEVSNLFVNYTSDYDCVYSETKYINHLDFNILINNLPANDISPSNTLDLELVFYERVKN